MMLIDDHIDPREHEKISEIYFYLHGEHPDPEYVERRSFQILANEELEIVSEVGKVISESINGERPRSLATAALVEIMMADEKTVEQEITLLNMIADLWGTHEILNEELKKFIAK